MTVEPFANDELRDNLIPVGRVYYSFLTPLCTPCSRSQEFSMCLWAQSGEKTIRSVVTTAGLHRFRRATEAPSNIVYEARLWRKASEPRQSERFVAVLARLRRALRGFGLTSVDLETFNIVVSEATSVCPLSRSSCNRCRTTRSSARCPRGNNVTRTSR